jgi:hypothetical protein
VSVSVMQWCSQGVLLLNAALTVRAKNSNSHAGGRRACCVSLQPVAPCNTSNAASNMLHVFACCQARHVVADCYARLDALELRCRFTFSYVACAHPPRCCRTSACISTPTFALVCE